MFEYKSKYIDFKGTEREESVFFHLSQTDIMKMELEVPGGYAAYGERIIKAKNIQELTKLFDGLIFKSYGVLSDDGSRFIKGEHNPKIYEDFISSPIYDEIFMKIMSDADFAATFFNEIIPKNLSEEIKKTDEYKALANINALPAAK